MSSLGSQIYSTKGKKTLNIEHILEARKAMNFNNHIKALMKELLELRMSEEKYEDHSNMKKLINRNKKKIAMRDDIIKSDNNEE